MKAHLRFLLLLTLLSTLSYPPSTAQAQGTAFTYQGRLNDGANLAAGSYDLRFAIYDSLSGGSVVSGPVTNAATSVTNGVFTVTLDFGPGVFDGDARWLGLAVRTNGPGAFVALSPRQALTSAPYAIYAPNAGAAATADTATSAATAATAVTANTAVSVAVNGVASASLQTDAVTSDKIADATIVEGDLAPALASSTFWRLDGNAGTTPALQFLGTTDEQPVELRANNLRALRLEPTPSDFNHEGIVNLVGGSPGNFIAPGTYGAVIGGGGALNLAGTAGTNIVEADFAFLGGGFANSIQPSAGHSVLVGGNVNLIQGDTWAAVLVGGEQNWVATNSAYATLVGGFGNSIQVNAWESFLGGGSINFIGENSSDAVIVGGTQNAIGNNSTFNFIGGGQNNQIQPEVERSVLVGGTDNRIETYASYSALVGGLGNSIQMSAWNSFLGGGEGNAISTGANHSFLGGGEGNTIEDAGESFLGGGSGNLIREGSLRSVIGGGLGNVLYAPYAVIGGGYYNTNESGAAFIGNGTRNTIETNSWNSVISGGGYNTIQSNTAAAFIGGGEGNTIQSNSAYSALGGGRSNEIEPDAYTAFLGGGNFNLIRTNADYAFLGGGAYNTNSGSYAMIPGGDRNFASGIRSFAAGHRAKATFNGAFVWADSQEADFTATAANQFLIRAAGFVGINKANPATALDVTGTVTATAFSGSGASLGSLNGGNITSGTVADARIASTLTRDTEVMTLVLANDGPGSGLNADVLDGFDSTAFATAGHTHYGASWTGAASKGLSVQTASTAAGGAAVYGLQGTGSGSAPSLAAGVWGDSSDGYGVIGLTRTTSGAAIAAYALATNGFTYGVYGSNSSTNGYGVVGMAQANSGVNYGVYGLSYSTDGIGVAGYAPAGGVAVKATGSGVIQSTADSYVFVPGNSLVKNLNTDTTRWDIQINGAARIWRGATAGTKTVYYPVPLPAQLYGQPITVESATVYYRCSNTTNSYISSTSCYKQTDADTSAVLFADVTSRDSTTAASYTLTPGGNNELSSTEGVLGFFVNLSFANDTDYVQIGGIRLRLSHE